jgi:hypothetical protein
MKRNKKQKEKERGKERKRVLHKDGGKNEESFFFKS